MMMERLAGLTARDRLFVFFMLTSAVVMVLFGVASLIISIIQDPSDAVIFRLVTAFAAMFTGWLGTATGYLLGKSTN